MKKRWMKLFMAIVFMGIALPVLTLQTEAASKDVTKQMASDKDLKQVCKMMAAYTTAMDISNQASADKKVLSLNDKDKLSIAAFVRYYYKDDFGYTKKELKTESRDLFGKEAATGIIKKAGKTNLLVCSADKKYVAEPFMYCGGEFGDGIPKYTIKKVTQIKKNVYQVEIDNKLGVYGEKGSENVGTTILKVKKTKASGYGYIVKGITYSAN